MEIEVVGPCRTLAERKSARRYQAEIIAAGLIYTALVFLSVGNVERVTGFLRVIVAEAPMLGVIGMSIAFVRFVLRLDELQRRTVIDAGAIALLVTICATMALGFLENAGSPRVTMSWVWSIGIFAWAVALPFVRRRYR